MLVLSGCDGFALSSWSHLRSAELLLKSSHCIEKNGAGRAPNGHIDMRTDDTRISSPEQATIQPTVVILLNAVMGVCRLCFARGSELPQRGGLNVTTGICATGCGPT